MVDVELPEEKTGKGRSVGVLSCFRAAVVANNAAAFCRSRRVAGLTILYGVVVVVVLCTFLSPIYDDVSLQDRSTVPVTVGGEPYFYTEKRPMNSRAVPPVMEFAEPVRTAPSQMEARNGLRKSSHHPPRIRFLWGILSTDREKDVVQRQAIRDTYLSFYKNTDHSYTQSGDSETPNRICSLSDYVQERIPVDECELIYVFVVGGARDDDAPKQMLDDVDPKRPLTIDLPSDRSEEDVIYLNIKENGKEGKTPTYFKWASSIVKDGSVTVDYIAKVDMDTILFPPRWFAFAQGSLYPAPYNRMVYGGMLLDKLGCGGLRKWHCRQLVNKNYMSGELYFLSPDLADFITSDRLDRKSLTYLTEDFTTGNYVHSSPQPVHQVVIAPKHALWEHGDQIKETTNYLKRYSQLKDTWRNRIPAITSDGLSSSIGGETEEEYQRSLRTIRLRTDEFYRRYPWRWFPDVLTRFDLP